MSQEELFINGDLLRLGRESRGWAVGDLATRACISVKQIRQLEEGGMSSFYSVAVKATAAKKVAALLGVAAEDVFAQHTDPVEAPIEHVFEDVSSETPTSVVEDVVEPTPVVESAQDVEVALEPEKSKTSLWVIVGLFTAALAVAAYLQPKDEPVVEPAPPLQVLPLDPSDAASAAGPSASAASADAVVSPSVQKPASVASAVAPSVNVPRASVSASAAATGGASASAPSKPQ